LLENLQIITNAIPYSDPLPDRKTTDKSLTTILLCSKPTAEGTSTKAEVAQLELRSSALLGGAEMSQVEGISIISEMFGDCPDAADEDLAELEAAAEQSEDEDLYAGLQCGEQPLQLTNEPVDYNILLSTLLLPADAEHDDEQGTIVVRQQRQQIQEVSPKR
jgi:hypothetical protein